MLGFGSDVWSTVRARDVRWVNLPSRARFVFSLDSLEERANPAMWREGLQAEPGRCIAIVATSPGSFTVRTATGERTLGLTDYPAIAEILGDEDVCIDVSGLAHPLWAALLKTALAFTRRVRVIYFEPDAYRYHASPSSVSLFDLSSSFLGVQPLPGFVNLKGPKEGAPTLFVTFLGFEGSRSRQVAMTLDPVPKVIPVLGLPGFKLPYPQWALCCNQEFLEENSAERNLRYASANCPFEAYRVLEEIRRDHPRSYLYLAPIGTKPHAIGAILYALDHPQDTEIMFDHPIKSAGRSTGVGTVHIYMIKDA